MASSVGKKYKLEKHDGITAIIIYRKKILLLKRRNLPIILNPGIWAFLSGSKRKREKHIQTAYREIKEEVKLDKSKLRLLYKTKALLKEERKKRKWQNHIFIFRTKTQKIKLDLENSAYRWATFSDIKRERNYTNIFINKEPILNRIRVFSDGSKQPQGKD